MCSFALELWVCTVPPTVETCWLAAKHFLPVDRQSAWAHAREEDGRWGEAHVSGRPPAQPVSPTPCRDATSPFLFPFLSGLVLRWCWGCRGLSLRAAHWLVACLGWGSEPPLPPLSPPIPIPFVYALLCLSFLDCMLDWSLLGLAGAPGCFASVLSQ